MNKFIRIGVCFSLAAMLFVSSVAVAQRAPSVVDTGTTNFPQSGVQATVAVTTTSSTVLAAQGTRVGCSITNIGSNNIRLNWAGAVASATNDQILYPSQTRTCNDSGLHGGAITAISETGTSNVVVISTIR